MDWLWWACILFVVIVIASAVYEQGVQVGFNRGCELTRRLYEEGIDEEEELDLLSARLTRELKEAQEERRKYGAREEGSLHNGRGSPDDRFFSSHGGPDI